MRLVCENHRDKAWPDECDCGAGMRESDAKREALSEALSGLTPKEQPVDLVANALADAKAGKWGM